MSFWNMNNDWANFEYPEELYEFILSYKRWGWKWMTLRLLYPTPRAEYNRQRLREIGDSEGIAVDYINEYAIRWN